APSASRSKSCVDRSGLMMMSSLEAITRVGVRTAPILVVQSCPFSAAIWAANVGPKAYAIPSGPFYPFLAALSVNITVITVIILGCFLFWALPSMIANTFMPIRSFFAWSFDRLMPEKLADVNERTHSPVFAIIVVNVIIAALTIWSVYSNVFQLVLGLIVLAGCLGVVIVACAAIALPIRRPDLYRASPANVKFLGIPVLYIVAPL